MLLKVYLLTILKTNCVLKIASEYQDNIVTVDKIVREIDELVSEHFAHDNRTSFIFTSDHGMTDWGRLCDLKEKYFC